MKVNDVAYITQYGNDYNFYLNENRSSIFIAGGIGIAPFRSMIKFAYDNELKSHMHLIYLNKGDSFIFAEELEPWKTKLPNLRITYLNTNELNRKKREKQLLDTVGTTAQRFFIAGPEGMVESTEHLLIDYGVGAKDIRIDSFGGY